jgi:hypothetical protein
MLGKMRMRLWFDKGWRIMFSVFAAGALTHYCLSPSSPQYHLRAAEREIRRNPAKYGQVAREMENFGHEINGRMTNQNNPNYVPLRDVRFQVDNEITMLVNSKTGEQAPIRYFGNSMVAGSDETLSKYAETREYDSSYRGRFWQWVSDKDSKLGGILTGDSTGK